MDWSGCFNELVCLVCFFRLGGLGVIHLPVFFGGGGRLS